MDLQKNTSLKLFEIRPTDSSFKIKSSIVNRGRSLIGRSESCDVIINHDAISVIHSVIEILDDKILVYDMNSTNGTYVNDEKILVKELRVGDKLSFANLEFVFIHYDAFTSPPPALDTLEPEFGAASVIPQIPEEAFKKDLPKTAPGISDIHSVIYPLVSDPRAEFSEFIFEQKEDLYPIFRYDSTRQAVEVIILFKDKVFSVDYLSDRHSQYSFAGIFSQETDVELPTLRRGERIPFMDIKSGVFTLYGLNGYEVLALSDKKKTAEVYTSISLLPNDIVRLKKGDIQIYVRQVLSPPRVIPAPIISRDHEFRTWILAMFILTCVFFVGLKLVPRNLEAERNRDEQQAPEKLSRILSQQSLNGILISKRK